MLNYILFIKPLSINQAFQGRRFKTPKYKQYERDCLIQLPYWKPTAAPYEISIEVGFSNSLSDLDNVAKPMIDIMQKKYGFNDRDVVRLIIEKTTVPKGKDFIRVKMKSTEKIVF